MCFNFMYFEIQFFEFQKILDGDTYTKVVVLDNVLKLCSWVFFHLNSFSSQSIQYKIMKYW